MYKGHDSVAKMEIPAKTAAILAEVKGEAVH